MPGTGLAEFRSRYQAIVLKPVCGQYLCLLTLVQRRSHGRKNHKRKQDGLLCGGGPPEHLRIQSPSPHRLQVPPGRQPTRIHIAHRCMCAPSLRVLTTQSLVKGRRVRVRIVGTRVDANEIVRLYTHTDTVRYWNNERRLSRPLRLAVHSLYHKTPRHATQPSDRQPRLLCPRGVSQQGAAQHTSTRTDAYRVPRCAYWHARHRQRGRRTHAVYSAARA